MSFTNHAPAAGAVGLFASLALATAALAQLSPSVSQTQKVNESVTVQAVDRATRHLSVKRPSGEVVSIKVPPEVKNFDQLQPGDAITASYYRETEISLLPAGAPPPQDMAAVVAGHAPEGSMPAGMAASRIVVTGAVLGIDVERNVLKVVSPSGGEVHEFAVVDPQGRRMLKQLKVGDRITAYVNESLLISASRG